MSSPVILTTLVNHVLKKSSSSIYNILNHTTGRKISGVPFSYFATQSKTFKKCYPTVIYTDSWDLRKRYASRLISDNKTMYGIKNHGLYWPTFIPRKSGLFPKKQKVWYTKDFAVERALSTNNYRETSTSESGKSKSEPNGQSNNVKRLDKQVFVWGNPTDQYTLARP